MLVMPIPERILVTLAKEQRWAMTNTSGHASDKKNPQWGTMRIWRRVTLEDDDKDGRQQRDGNLRIALFCIILPPAQCKLHNI